MEDKHNHLMVDQSSPLTPSTFEPRKVLPRTCANVLPPLSMTVSDSGTSTRLDAFRVRSRKKRLESIMHSTTLAKAVARTNVHRRPRITHSKLPIAMLLSPKGFLRLASACVGLMLFIVSCLGFNTLKLSVYSLDSQAEFGCLCFLGVCFGLLLTFGESKWELFFFFFGFMRYRFGRACIFGVSGIMTAILGKTRNNQCNCSDNTILIIEGVALMAMTVLQTLAIFVLGNNSAPKRSKDSAQTLRMPVATPLPVTAPRSTPLPKETASFQAVVQPVVQAPAPVAAPAIQASPAANENDLPSWMHTP